MSIVRKFTDAIFNEIRAILREYVHETEAAIKKRLQRLLITGVIISILVSLVITMLGTADLFLTIGELKYLSTMMPAWKAWDIMGVTSGVSGAVLFLVLYAVIKKQLKSL